MEASHAKQPFSRRTHSQLRPPPHPIQFSVLSNEAGLTSGDSSSPNDPASSYADGHGHGVRDGDTHHPGQSSSCGAQGAGVAPGDQLRALLSRGHPAVGCGEHSSVFLPAGTGPP